ncbi:alkaline phosphatase family protein [Natrarchaeobius oligotrophus]|uniref:Phosphodiesterase n=1 Tax=Natrarchaeobius chitinivorans TaxID=1679083 RepID=A0A3N6MER9_NATCH|nr:alkaline phosphatase family protein [Natrarchaeobius chitinivorans]RQG99354.1 phosphodiesterase [Natrarchaeobius chitinivorans]
MNQPNSDDRDATSENFDEATATDESTETARESTNLETLLVGIDAACLSTFDRLERAGRIPTIRRLRSDGVAAPLESQIPPWTPSAWPSIYTGVNPGKHGAIGFVGYEGYDWHVTSSDDVDAHPFWTLLDRQGRTSVVVNVPVTHPPDDFDGAIVPGFLGPEDPTCHPEGVLEDVRDAIGEYRVYPNYVRDDDSISDEEKMAEYRRLIEMRGEAFRYLVDEHDPEFGFVQFQKTDTVFHEFAGDEENVETVYEATDAQIGAILEACDPDRVFLVSDHGMGPYDGYEFRINEFLRDEGYLETTTGGKGMPSWTPMRRRLREGEEYDSWEPGTVARAASVAAHFGVTARRVRAALERVGLADLATKYAPGGVSRTANEQVDFAASKAYVRARTELGVRINLEGREPDGVVSPDEYERVREALIRTLQRVETPDGEPFFETVAPREQYFHGENVDRTVDVVTIPAAFDHTLSEQVRTDGDYFAPTEPWNHKLDGVFVAAGDGIAEDASLDRVHLFDVAPTVMASMGVPYSDRMDGEVAPIVDRTDPISYAAYADRGNRDRTAVGDEVTDRLADLGYVD